MGKKKPEEMAQASRDLRRRRAANAACRRAKATQLFDLMEKFAGYGFNKSHAAAYALVAYQTAYFKAHHPAAFMAANLSLVMDDTDKVRQFYVDALAQRPRRCCRRTSTRRTIASSRSTRQRIRYGLGGDQGHGRSGDRGDRRRAREQAAVHRPVRLLPPRRQARRQPARGRGADPCRRVRRHRAAARSLLASVGAALDHAEHADRAASQVSLFGDGGDEEQPGRH